MCIRDRVASWLSGGWTPLAEWGRVVTCTPAAITWSNAITACAVATGCCISDVPCQWEGHNFDPHSSHIFNRSFWNSKPRKISGKGFRVQNLVDVGRREGGLRKERILAYFWIFHGQLVSGDWSKKCFICNVCSYTHKQEKHNETHVTAWIYSLVTKADKYEQDGRKVYQAWRYRHHHRQPIPGLVSSWSARRLRSAWRLELSRT